MHWENVSAVLPKLFTLVAHQKLSDVHMAHLYFLRNKIIDIDYNKHFVTTKSNVFIDIVFIIVFYYCNNV